MKAPSLPPPLPSPLRIRATALATAVSFLPTSANTHEVPAHAAWVRKGAALVIQRAYRAWMKRRGEKRHQKTGLCGGCTPAYAARWWSADPATDARARVIIARGVPALFSQMMRAVKTQLEQEERERVAREKQARKQAKTIAERWEQVQRHRIMLQPQTQSSGDCWFCGKIVGKYPVISQLIVPSLLPSSFFPLFSPETILIQYNRKQAHGNSVGTRCRARG